MAQEWYLKPTCSKALAACLAVASAAAHGKPKDGVSMATAETEHSTLPTNYF